MTSRARHTTSVNSSSGARKNKSPSTWPKGSSPSPPSLSPDSPSRQTATVSTHPSSTPSLPTPAYRTDLRLFVRLVNQLSSTTATVAGLLSPAHYAHSSRPKKNSFDQRSSKPHSAPSRNRSRRPLCCHNLTPPSLLLYVLTQAARA
jgi:hypothetical protein